MTKYNIVSKRKNIGKIFGDTLGPVLIFYSNNVLIFNIQQHIFFLPFVHQMQAFVTRGISFDEIVEACIAFENWLTVQKLIVEKGAFSDQLNGINQDRYYF